MRTYCKAYHVRDLRAFEGWSEKREENASALTDEDVVYLWDDLTVVRSPVLADKGNIYDAITPQWQEFCQNVLHFEIPADVRYAYEHPEPAGKGNSSSGA